MSCHSVNTAVDLNETDQQRQEREMSEHVDWHEDKLQKKWWIARKDSTTNMKLILMVTFKEEDEADYNFLHNN